MFPRECFITNVTFPVLRQTDAFVHVILELGEDEERLTTGAAEEPLGLVSSHVSLQSRQVGADNTALVTGEVGVQLNVMHLEVVLVQQSSLLETSFA